MHHATGDDESIRDIIARGIQRAGGTELRPGSARPGSAQWQPMNSRRPASAPVTRLTSAPRRNASMQRRERSARPASALGIAARRSSPTSDGASFHRLTKSVKHTEPLNLSSLAVDCNAVWPAGFKYSAPPVTAGVGDHR